MIYVDDLQTKKLRPKYQADTGKLNKFKIGLNNRLQVFQELLNKGETTIKNEKGSKTLTSMIKEVLGRKKHHHKERTSTEILDKRRKGGRRKSRLKTVQQKKIKPMYRSNAKKQTSE